MDWRAEVEAARQMVAIHETLRMPGAAHPHRVIVEIGNALDAALRERDDARAEAERLRAERDRLQRACDEGLPREYIACPACGKQHVEGPRHDNPAIDGRTRPHHTHRCYHCGHVWDAGRWSFGADVPKPADPVAAEREACAAMLGERAAAIPVCSCCGSGEDRRGEQELRDGAAAIRARGEGGAR